MAKQKVTITPKGKKAPPKTDSAENGASPKKVTITPKGKGASGKGKVTITPKGKGAGKKVTITPKGKGAPKEKQAAALARAEPSVPARQPSALVSLLDFPPGLADGVRDVFMAGLGALATLEDEAQSLFSTLVKRGERWEAEARGARPEQAPDQAAILAERLGQQLRAAVHDAVQAATHDRASQDDLRALRKEVAALGAKLDALAARPAEEAPPPTPPTLLEVRTAEQGGWVLTRDGEPAQTLPTKAAATEAAYLLGEEVAPAEIVLYKMNGDEQRRITLDAE